MLNRFFLVAAIGMGIATTACGAGENGDDTTGESEAELRTAGIKSIRVSYGGGLAPPVAPPACRRSGQFKVDFVGGTIAADACVANARVDVTRALDSAELARVKAAVSGVRTVKAPTTCPTDLPTTSLTVNKARSSTTYVDDRSSCFLSDGVPAKASTLRSLLEVLESLVAPPPVQEETVDGTLRNVIRRGGGYAIDTGSKNVELQLSDDQAATFVAGRVARAIGEPYVSNIGGTHDALHVRDLVVCPASGATINCMPPTDAPLCGEHHQWANASCPGIQFVY